MKRVMIAVLLCLLAFSTAHSRTAKYGEWVQTVQTEVGPVQVEFVEVDDPWRFNAFPGRIVIKLTSEPFNIKVDWLDDPPFIELLTPSGGVVLFFLGPYEKRHHTKRMIDFEKCPNLVIYPLYRLRKPKPNDVVYKKDATYTNFSVDLSQDYFVNVEAYKRHYKEKSRILSSHSYSVMPIEEAIKYATIDLDENKIFDIYNKNSVGEDLNADTIDDKHQTFASYNLTGLSNFIDLDKDGLCDNYIEGIYQKQTLTALYPKFTIDLSRDLFQNRDTAHKRSLRYIDQNKDGINDIFQNSEYAIQKAWLNERKFHFVDKNNDTINDYYQTQKAYFHYKMTNFIDRDGDGLCDNYQ